MAEVYLVGGAVRDGKLGREVTDKDWVVVGVVPDDLISQGYTQVGKDFPVFLHPESKEEYALARTERKTGKGYAGFACNSSPSVTLEEDLLRRDLTINAMAQDKSGNTIDPYGGLADLDNRVLRHVSPAFSEDPVRILRVARFAAKLGDFDFVVAPETMALMQEMVANNMVDELVPERVWQEFSRALAESHPTKFIGVLRDCGALARIFPSLDALWGVPQTAKWHPEVDTGIHVMLVLEQVSLLTSSPVLRFAALCHDLGKGVTPKAELPSHKGHETAGIPLVANWCEHYKVPVEYKRLALKVCQWHLHSHRVFDLNPGTIVKLFSGLDVWRNKSVLSDYTLVCMADARGRYGKEHDYYIQRDYLLLLYKAALLVTAKPLVAAGYTGKILGERLHRARVNMVKLTQKIFLALIELILTNLC